MTCTVPIFRGIQKLSAYFAWQSSVSNCVQFGMKSVENTDKIAFKAVSKVLLWAGIAQSV